MHTVQCALFTYTTEPDALSLRHDHQQHIRKCRVKCCCEARLYHENIEQFESGIKAFQLLNRLFTKV